MGYLLRMSAEIHDWLADLGRGDPPAALLAGEALAALMSEGASLGPPLVTEVADPRLPGEPGEALDRSYQVRLEQLQVARRRAAGVAELVHDAQNQLAELESTLARLEDQRRAALAADRPEEAATVADQLGAAALVAGNGARTLAEQRTRLGLTQAELAQRMGVRQERVSAIERAEPGASEVRTLASYVAALGGRLELVADFGAERVLLR